MVHNLPLQLTSFVGRERELAQVGRLLSTTRLLSLTGAGGVGKTRLAVEAAAGLIDRFKHGVCVVELAPVADEALVPRAVASALYVREDQRRPLLETVSRYLQRRELLLVLDNCEHLIGGCAALADHVLRNCPGVSILATSRQSLNTPGEMVWLVPSLSVPELPGGQVAGPEVEQPGSGSGRNVVDQIGAQQVRRVKAGADEREQALQEAWPRLAGAQKRFEPVLDDDRLGKWALRACAQGAVFRRDRLGSRRR